MIKFGAVLTEILRNHDTVTQRYRYTVTPLHHGTVTPWPRYIMIPLYRDTVTSWYRYIMIPLYRDTATPWHRYLMIPLHCDTTRPLRSNMMTPWNLNISYVKIPYWNSVSKVSSKEMEVYHKYITLWETTPFKISESVK